MNILRLNVLHGVIAGALLTCILSNAYAAEICQPPFYRKIQLNGMPMLDPKPYEFARTDHSPAITYIDALTLQLHYNNIDLEIPLPRKTFSLCIRRNWLPFVPIGEELPSPIKQLDAPFGAGWSSSLCPNLHIIDGSPYQPIYAVVTDEEGLQHRFIKAYSPDGKETFLPLPSNDHEEDVTQETLTLENGKTWVFRKKYGTDVRFSAVAPRKIWPEVNDMGSIHFYYRISSVRDRFGDHMDYYFLPGNDGLVPDRIVYRDQHLEITHTPSGLIQTVRDTMDNKYVYTYEPAESEKALPLLNSVIFIAPGTKQTLLSYRYERLGSGKPDSQDDSSQPLCLQQITDALKHAYLFHYKFGENLHPVVTQVELPNHLGTSSFESWSSFYGNIQTPVLTWIVDADGNGKLYSFSELRHIPWNNTLLVPPGTRAIPAKPDLFAYEQMQIEAFDGSRVSKLGTHAIAQAPSALLAIQNYTFDIAAGFSLKKAVDPYGNTFYFQANHRATPACGMELPYSQREADITEAIDPLDQKQKFFYNSLSHQLARRIDEAGVVWDKAFDSLGRVVSEKVYGSEAKIQFDQQAFQVDYFYDSHLFPDLATRKIIRKLTPSPPAPRWERDLVTMIKPDLNGLESEIIADPGGVSETTQNIYDVEGHLIRRIYPDGTTVVMSYDPMGHLSTIICHGLNGSKPVKAMDYDAAGRLIRQIDPDGTISLFQYDALDRLTQKTVKKGDESNTTDISYNPVNSVVLERVDKTSYIMHRYDGLQRVVHETRSDGGSWDFFYGTNSGSFLFKNSTFGATEERRSDFSAIINKRDALGRAAKTTLRPYVFLPIAKRSIFREWNPRGYLMQETDSAKGKTTWEYDILGRWIRTTFPTGQSQRIAYTSTSLLYLWSDCIGFRKTWEYDGAARPITPVH